MKKASVITVCFNSELTIADTISSVADQVYPELEHIIIDGNSTDETLEIARTFVNDRMLIKTEDDQGIYDAMNKGISIASGDVIFILNSDDVFNDSNVVAKIMERFNANELLDMVITNVTFNKFDKPGKPISRYISVKNYNFKLLRFGWMPPHPGIVVSRSFYEKNGLYKCWYTIAADYEFVVRAYITNKLVSEKLNLISVNMRPGGVSTKSLKHNFVITKEIIKAFRENNSHTNVILLLPRLIIKPLVQIFLKGFRK